MGSACPHSPCGHPPPCHPPSKPHCTRLSRLSPSVSGVVYQQAGGIDKWNLWQVMAALQIDDMSPEKKRAVELDLAAKITSLKNSAYSNGFKAARGAVADYCK